MTRNIMDYLKEEESEQEYNEYDEITTDEPEGPSMDFTYPSEFKELDIYGDYGNSDSEVPR